jgi:hypothetical protein
MWSKFVLVVSLCLFALPVWAMEHHTNVLFDNKGNAIKDATVSVFISGTTTPAILYSDNGVTVKANPFLTSHATNSPGAYDFYATDGVYDLVFTKAGYSFNNLLTRRLALFDITGGGAGIGGGLTSFPLSPTLGQVVIITDDSAVGACDSAGGTSVTLCRWNGSSWVKLGDGTSVGGSLSAGDIDTSAELSAIVTDETGTGPLVFGLSPTITSAQLINPAIFGTITGTISIIPDGGTVATPLTTLFGRELWVKDFGLTGQANDAVVFQAAIDAVTAAGNGILHLPCSQLNIGTSVTYSSNITFQGCGMGLSILYATSTLPLKDPMMKNVNDSPGDGVRTDKNVFFQDLTMDGAGRDYPAWDVGTQSPAMYGGLTAANARGNMLRMYSVDNGGLTRVELKNHESLGINLAGSRGIKISHSYFHDNGKVDDIASPVYVPDHSFNNLATETADIQISFSLFRANRRSAISFYPAGGGSLTNNWMEDNGESTIFGVDGKHLLIAHNYILRNTLTDITAHGIEENNCINCSFSFNTIVDVGENGISANGMIGGSIKGNTIVRPGHATVYPGGPFNFAAGRAPGDPIDTSNRSGIKLLTGNTDQVLNVDVSDNTIFDDAVSPTMVYGITINRTGTPLLPATNVNLNNNCFAGYTTAKYNFVSQAMTSSVRVKDCGTTNSVDFPVYGASVAIDNRLTNSHIIIPTNGTAFTIGDPANDAAGDLVRITIDNTFGTLGAVTWNAVYKLESIWAQPNNGEQRTITFLNDGTNLREISRTGSSGGSFDTLGGGTNISSAMTVGSGATLTYSGSGVLNASTFRGNAVVGVADGGTNLTAAADDTLMLGNGTTWIASSLPSCSNGTTSKLLYNNTTNAFSCGTDQSAGGGTTFDTIGSGTNTTMAAIVDSGASIGISGTGSITSTNFWPNLVTVNAGNSPYTALTSNATILCDTTAGARIITLPAATVKVFLTFFNMGSNTCTINRAGADTITTGVTSGSSFVLRNPGSTFWLQPDGVSIWYVGG